MLKRIVIAIMSKLGADTDNRELGKLLVAKFDVKRVNATKVSGGLGEPKERKTGGLEEVTNNELKDAEELYEFIDELIKETKTTGGLGMPKSEEEVKLQLLYEEYMRNVRSLNQIEEMIMETLDENENWDLFDDRYEIEFQLDTISKAIELLEELRDMKQWLTEACCRAEVQVLERNIEKTELELESLEGYITSIPTKEVA